MKNILLALILVTTTLPGLAQKKNRIELGLGGYHFFDVIGYYNRPYTLGSISYQRNFSEDLVFRIGATNTIRNYLVDIYAVTLTQEQYSGDKNAIDKIERRTLYYFFDLSVSYRFFDKGSNQFSAFAGPSMAYGRNEYLRAVHTDDYYEGELVSETYSGAVAGLRYDYLFWQDRLNVGFEVLGRYYFGDFPFQLNYGLRVGYNF